MSEGPIPPGVGPSFVLPDEEVACRPARRRKTSRSRQLADEHGALRLTPDEWLLPLLGAANGERERDVIEGRFLWVAQQLLRSGTSVVLDLGVWSRDERAALRALADGGGARCELVYLPVDPAEQRRRITERWAPAPGSTYATTDEDLAAWRATFEVPDSDELAGRARPTSPEGFPSWDAWTAWRWPTSAG